jgi:hypothetical protein
VLCTLVGLDVLDHDGGVGVDELDALRGEGGQAAHATEEALNLGDGLVGLNVGLDETDEHLADLAILGAGCSEKLSISNLSNVANLQRFSVQANWRRTLDDGHLLKIGDDLGLGDERGAETKLLASVLGV